MNIKHDKKDRSMALRVETKKMVKEQHDEVENDDVVLFSKRFYKILKQFKNGPSNP